LCWHRLGRDPAGDEPVFGDGLPATTGLWPQLFHHRWLTLRTTLGTARDNALWVADVRAAGAARLVFRPVLPEPLATAVPSVGLDGRMYLRTTLGAGRGRVCAVGLADLERLGPEHWREVVPEQPDSVLRAVVPLAGGQWGPQRLFLVRSRDRVSAAGVHDPDSGALLREVELPGAGSLSLPVVPPGGGRSLWFRYTDLTTPATVLRYDLDPHRVSVHARPPGDAAAMPATSRTVEYRSADGTTVRMFLITPPVCADGPDRPRPCLLTGYGGFGVSMAPRYSYDVIPWVAAGGVVAVACVRGGGEDGDRWHRAGTGAGKRRAVEDLNAAAEWLVNNGWCGADQLAALGTSNGGLLVAAAMVQRPELYRAVAAVAPLTDMVRYELSGLGPLWRAEYGTVDDPVQFRALLSYSPYHHVRPGTAYPATLLVTPEADTRVDPLHGRKLCAALQHATAGTHPVLLRTLPDTGHGGGAPSRAMLTVAETLAFLADRTGLAVR
jgi:prolyl oligopeptidase